MAKLKGFSWEGILTYRGITGNPPSLVFCATGQGKNALVFFALAPRKLPISR